MGVAEPEPIPDAVVDALGLDHGEGERLAGGRVSRFWSASRGGEQVAVRQSPWFRTTEEVRYELDLLGRISDCGGPVATPVADATVAGVEWAAFSWIPGSHPARPVSDPALYGRLLAQLHGYSARACGSSDQRPRWGRVDEFLTLPRAGGDATLEQLLPDFEKATGSLGTRLRHIAEEVDERLSTLSASGWPKVVAHGDFGPHQVLFDSAGRLTGVVDWDFCHVDLRLADLAIATSLARPTPERAGRMLAAYLDEAGEEIGDLAAMGDFRRAFHLNNLANQVCALWVHGIDISAGVATITERLDREQWWDPLLRHAVRSSLPIGVAAPSAPVVDESDLGLARSLAARARIVALHYFDRGVVTEAKDDESPVTEADHAVERLLREALADDRPGDAILGEEFGASGSGDRVWILDPIDGTNSFAQGDSDWRIQIALEERGEIVLGVVDAPALAATWWATQGGGAFEEIRAGGAAEARRLAVRGPGDLAGATVACYPVSLGDRLPIETARPPRKGLALIDLVRGEIDGFFVECCAVWDHAPWVLLVTEAGGEFTDHAGGRSPARRGGLYSTSALHQPLLAALGIPN